LKKPAYAWQIVLRIYNSISEILTGFDIDSSGAAYDGKQVYCTPRALQSYMTQINHIDLTRRSPSYENRLSKYSHRGFEVYWPDLDRTRVDPTIFERSFQRTLGLARLLVLERLPTSTVRESYLDTRRRERGRPEIDRYNRFWRSNTGNIKDQHEDEIADWVNEEEVSNYHTFTIPYGQKFHAKKIEKLCYTRDLRKLPRIAGTGSETDAMDASPQCRMESVRRQRGLPSSASRLLRPLRRCHPGLLRVLPRPADRRRKGDRRKGGKDLCVRQDLLHQGRPWTTGKPPILANSEVIFAHTRPANWLIQPPYRE
jgi:hypothetical protein